MKGLLVCCWLLLPAFCHAQHAPTNGQEATQPFKDATAITIHSPDSARVAYTKTLRALLAAGYSIDKSDKDVLAVRTGPRVIKDVYALTLQAFVLQEGGGSDITFRGSFLWSSSIALLAGTDKRQVEVRCMGGGNTPIQQMWNELLRTAQAPYPAAPVAYK